MRKLKNRVDALEREVAELREMLTTLATLQNMHLSEQMTDYIQKKNAVVRLTELINSAAGSDAQIDLTDQQAAVEQIRSEKMILDEQISRELRRAEAFSDSDSKDWSCFHCLDVVGGVKIVRYIGADYPRVDVPPMITGRPVVAIGDNAFKDSDVVAVYLPRTLKSLGDWAFSGCKRLFRIALPEGLVSIGQGCFRDCGIRQINLPHTVTSIGSGCFAGSALEKVSMPNKLEAIPFKCFSGCKNLRHIVLPDKLVKLEDECFHFTGIQELVIPESTETVSNAFSYDTNVHCAFLGMKTTLKDQHYITIYCLPGSEAQRYGRINNMTVRPLSEFRMEER